MKVMDILDDMGVSKLSAKVFFFFKVKYSFKGKGQSKMNILFSFPNLYDILSSMEHKT